MTYTNNDLAYPIPTSLLATFGPSTHLRMAPSLLYHFAGEGGLASTFVDNDSKAMNILMTVFIDACKLETEDVGKRKLLGWFADEVSALSAAAEHVLIGSAILPTLRRLPELVICCEYKEEFCKRTTLEFRRATRVKWTAHGRRVVRRPGTWGKAWMREGVAA